MPGTTEVPKNNLAKVTVRVEIVDEEGVASEVTCAMDPASFRFSQNRSVVPQYDADKLEPTSFKVGLWDVSISGQQLADS